MFFKIGVLKNFTKSSRKTSVLESLVNKVSSLRPATLLRIFSCEYCIFVKIFLEFFWRTSANGCFCRLKTWKHNEFANFWNINLAMIPSLWCKYWIFHMSIFAICVSHWRSISYLSGRYVGGKTSCYCLIYFGILTKSYASVKNKIKINVIIFFLYQHQGELLNFWMIILYIVGDSCCTE